MLVADGHLVADGLGTFRVAGELGDLHVPETLHALIAARLDALEPAERAIVQDAAVLGQTFSLPALAALTGDDAAGLEPRLRSLVRREILGWTRTRDPRSEGQHGFTQALLREVAYGTLARRDRRAKHLAAARYYETLGDEAVAGMLATHYVDAYLAAPDGEEGAAIAGQARIALRAAADRASALGSHDQAIAFLERCPDRDARPGRGGRDHRADRGRRRRGRQHDRVVGRLRRGDRPVPGDRRPGREPPGPRRPSGRRC